MGDERHRPEKAKRLFLKDNGRYVTERDSADFTRIVQEPDSGSVLYNVMEYYPNGNPKLIGKSSAVDPIKLEGQSISFYPNKSKKRVCIYDKGQPSGEIYDYYPNGKLYRTSTYIKSADKNSYAPFNENQVIQIVYDSTGVETVKNGNGHYQIFSNNFKYTEEDGDIKDGKRNGIWKGILNKGKVAYAEEYADGKFIKGTRTNEDGSTTNYTVKEALPSYEGGNDGFGRYLAQTLRYPKIARDQGLEGTLIAGFLLDENGNIATARILKSLSNETDKEVIQTFKAAKKWKPATQNGLAVPMEATVTVTFILPNPTMGNILVDEIIWSLPKNP